MHAGDVFSHPNAERLRASVDEALSVAITFTPRDALEAMEEDGAELDPEARAEQIRVAVRVRAFIAFAEFLAAGVSQACDLELRALILLRAVAPDVLLQRYKLTVREAIRREEKISRARTRSGLLPGRMASLADLLRGGIDEEENELAQQQGITPRELRRRVLAALCEQVAASARKLEDFGKVALAVLRRAKPDALEDLGESQVEISRKFDEQRATVSAREIRVVEKPLAAAGVRGHLLGGCKSDAHRAACALAQVGNTNRADGEARKRNGAADDDDGQPAKPLTGARARVAQRRAQMLAELRDAAEQRRLVQLFGEGVAGCEPARTLPVRLTNLSDLKKSVLKHKPKPKTTHATS